MTNEEKKLARYQLKHLRDEMLENLDEMADIIIQLTSDDNQMIYERAKVYWLAHVKNALNGKKFSMCDFADTLKELDEMGEEED